MFPPAGSSAFIEDLCRTQDVQNTDKRGPDASDGQQNQSRTLANQTPASHPPTHLQENVPVALLWPFLSSFLRSEPPRGHRTSAQQLQLD